MRSDREKKRFDVSRATSRKWERALASKKVLLKKAGMVGPFPFALFIYITPYVWIDLEASGATNLEFTVTKSAVLKGKVVASVTSRSITPAVTFDLTPAVVDLQSQAGVQASFTARVGPRVEINFNAIPLLIDGAIGFTAECFIMIISEHADGERRGPVSI